MPFSRGGTLFEDHTHPSGLVLPADLDPALLARITTLEADADTLRTDLDRIMNPPTALVTSDAAANISDNTLTLLPFNVNTLLTGGMVHPTGAGNTAVTVPVTGLYALSAHIAWVANATGTREMFFTINGSLRRESQVPAVIASTMGQGIHLAAIQLTAGDTVELTVRHTAGGPLTPATVISNGAPSLAVRYVGTGL